MHFSFTSIYRSLYEDCLILWDTFVIFKSSRNVTDISDFRDGLQVLMYYAETDKIHIKKNSLLNAEDRITLPILLWVFFHSVILEFCIDELSQFPFWIAKTNLTMNPIPNTTYLTNIALLFHKAFTVSPMQIVEGSIPYLVLAFTRNYSKMDKPISLFVEALLKYLKPSASTDSNDHFNVTDNGSQERVSVNKQQQPKHNLTSSKGSNVEAPSPSPKHSRIPSSGAVAPGNTVAKDVLFFRHSYLKTVATRILQSLLSHPSLGLLVRMTCDSSLSGKTLVKSVIEVFRSEGLQGFYAGLSASLVLSLTPVPLPLLCGLAETILYGHILQRSASRRAAVSLLAATRTEINPLTNDESAAASGPDSSSLTMAAWTGMRQSVLELVASGRSILFGSGRLLGLYGVLSCAHVVPGFLIFCAVRAVSAVVLGPSPLRISQFAARRKLLLQHWQDRDIWRRKTGHLSHSF